MVQSSDDWDFQIVLKVLELHHAPLHCLGDDLTRNGTCSSHLLLLDEACSLTDGDNRKGYSRWGNQRSRTTYFILCDEPWKKNTDTSGHDTAPCFLPLPVSFLLGLGSDTISAFIARQHRLIQRCFFLGKPRLKLTHQIMKLAPLGGLVVHLCSCKWSERFEGYSHFLCQFCGMALPLSKQGWEVTYRLSNDAQTYLVLLQRNQMEHP